MFAKPIYVIFYSCRLQVPPNVSMIKIGDDIIERVFKSKFLGVILDHSLKFSEHVLNVVKKLSKFVPIIYRIRKYLDEPILKILYHTLIYPNLTYCITAWGGSYNNSLNPLKIVHKKIIRAIKGACRFAHSEPLFLDLGLLNLDTTHRYMTGTYVYRSLNNPLISTFYYRSSDVNTRESVQNLLEIPLITSTLCRQVIHYRGSTIFNSIPLQIRSYDNYVTFKINFKKLLLLNI